MRSLRLHLATVYLLCLVLAPSTRANEGLTSAIDDLIEGHAGKVAVALRILDENNEITFAWDHRGDDVMPTASLIKLPIMIEAYRQASEQRIALDDKLTLDQDDKVPGSGILTEHISPGATFTVRDAIRLMIRYSDNTATNLLLDKIGLAATAETMRSMGFTETQIHSKVYRRDTSIAVERSERYGLGSTRANDMVELLTAIQRRELVSAEACEAMLEHLETCDDSGCFPRLLPPQTRVAHKTGAVARSRTAAGILYTPASKIVLCVLTDENQDTSWSDDNAASLLCAKLAKTIFDFVSRESVPTEPGLMGMSASGELVESLQRTLNARLRGELSIDGDFGPATEAAVKKFQRTQSLPVTGVMNTATWQSLGELVPDLPEQVAAPEIVNDQHLPLAPALDPDGPPDVTAKAYAILDASDGRLLADKAGELSIPIASTTKLMTAYLVLEQAEAQPEILDEIVTFSKRADDTGGSTAGIRADERLSVHGLMYAMLLPSGNDASVALAEHFGDRLAAAPDQADAREADAKEADAKETDANETDDSETAANESDSYDRFIAAMNRKATELGLRATHFVNPHGMTAPGHHSSANDLARLAHRALELPGMRGYVSCRQRGCRLTDPDGHPRNVIWKSTNRLLGQDGFSGVKTGTTDVAGACLIACGEQAGKQRIVVVLGSSSSDARYTDARNLFAWTWRQALLAN